MFEKVGLAFLSSVFILGGIMYIIWGDLKVKCCRFPKYVLHLVIAFSWVLLVSAQVSWPSGN